MKFILVLLLYGSFSIFAQAPRFSGPFSIFDGGVPINVGNYGSPFVYDWNGDGKKDLILGQFSNGYIRFYSNIGTDPNPQFSGYEYLYASGSQISLPYG